MTVEIRYWTRVGMPVNKETALMLAKKMANDGTDIGVIHDDDMGEFSTVGSFASEMQMVDEIESLFAREQNEADTQVDDDIKWILVAMDFEKKRKAFIMEKKESGMTLDEAKAAYDTAKARIVKDALDLPDEPLDVPPTYEAEWAKKAAEAKAIAEAKESEESEEEE